MLIFRRGAARAASSPWRALRFPAYRRWAGAHLISTMGTWLQIVAQNLLVLTLTGSPVLAGLSAAASAVPSLLLGPVGGALADRWPHRVVAAIGQTLLAVIAATTGLLAAAGALSVPALVALAIASGVVGTVNGPATALLGNELVAPDDVPSAISIGSVTFNVGRIAGAAAAGIVLGAMSIPAAYALNAVSFLCVVAVIATLPAQRPGVVERRTVPRDRGLDLRGGTRWLAGQPSLLLLATVSVLASTLTGSLSLSLAPLTLDELHAGSRGYGAVSLALGVGATLGALLAGRLRRPRVATVVVLAGVGAIVQVGAAGSPTLVVLLVAAVGMSLVESVAATASSTLLLTRPPEAVRGRVMGVWSTVSGLGGLAGPVLAGGLLSLFGPRAGLAVGGLVFVAGLVVAVAATRFGRRAALAHVRVTRDRLRAVRVLPSLAFARS
ncbi:MAG TPA: MFS transporter [Blastococcus sp.]